MVDLFFGTFRRTTNMWELMWDQLLSHLAIYPFIYLFLCLSVRPSECLFVSTCPAFWSTNHYQSIYSPTYLSIGCSGRYGEFWRNNVNSTLLWNQHHDKLHAVSWWKTVGIVDSFATIYIYIYIYIWFFPATASFLHVSFREVFFWLCVYPGGILRHR